MLSNPLQEKHWPRPSSCKFSQSVSIFHMASLSLGWNPFANNFQTWNWSFFVPLFFISGPLKIVLDCCLEACMRVFGVAPDSHTQWREISESSPNLKGIGHAALGRFDTVCAKKKRKHIWCFKAHFNWTPSPGLLVGTTVHRKSVKSWHAVSNLYNILASYPACSSSVFHFSSLVAQCGIIWMTDCDLVKPTQGWLVHKLMGNIY